jgi:hypothetical protein
MVAIDHVTSNHKHTTPLPHYDTARDVESVVDSDSN